MKLRQRMLIIFSLAMVVFIAAIFVISQSILLRGFVKLEEQDTRRNVELVLSTLSNSISELAGTTSDWALWDDTYAFIQDSNDKYIDSNLVAGSFVHLRVNVMLFFDASGRMVAGKGFDIEEATEAPIPQSLVSQLTRGSVLLSHASTESHVAGIILLPESPLLVASFPILTSQGEGPVRGTLIMGRYLNAAEIKRLAAMTLLSLQVRRYDNQDLSADFQPALAYLSDASPVFVQTLDGQNVGGYARLKDIYGKPALVFRVDIPRDIYQQGGSTVTYLLIMMIIAALALGTVMMLVINSWVLSRLARLNSGVGSIGVSGNFSARVDMPGKDEISTLAGNINAMLTALEHSHQKLGESEEQYRDLFQNAGDLVQSVTPDGHFRYVNPAWQETLGYREDEIAGLKIFDIIHPDSQEHCRNIFQRVMSGEKVEEFEADFITRDGIKITVVGNATCKFIDGKPVYTRGIFHDVTHRKQMDGKLQEIYLEEKELRQKLEAEIKKRAEFTRALIHELKTPITPVLASSELLADEMKEEPWHSLARNIFQGATNLNNRIDELLDLARGEIGMLHVEMNLLEPIALLRQMAEQVDAMLLARAQSLVTQFPDSLPVIMADEARLRQVILNLIGNASKFTPAKGIITVRARQDKNNLVVDVQDTGPGIPEDRQKLLFQPYMQLGSDLQYLRGMGLGLALSRVLVELHGGRIWLKSQEGEGSTFSFSIPLAPPAPPAESRET